MAANNGSLDANALLDWLLYRDQSRADSVQALIDTPGELSVADITLVEVAYVLEKVYRYPRSLIRDNISRIIEDPAFDCRRALFRSVLPMYVSQPALSFADCCAAHCARLADAMPLHTYDKKLANQSSGLARLIVA